MKRRINLQLLITLALGIIAAFVVCAAIFSHYFGIEYEDIKGIIPEFFVYGAMILVVLGLTGGFFTVLILKPLKKLSDSIEREDLDAENWDSEYKELSSLIETMKKQNRNVVDNADMRQQFTANVTHELKTPLAAITGYSELIENGMASGDDVRRFAGEIRRNSIRLLTLINDTIRLSELDMIGDQDEWEYVDLYRVADTCVSMLQFAAESNDIEMELEGESTSFIGNKRMIEELVYNLCDNAIRYNVKGGKVKVSIKEDESTVILSVSDTGIGIPKSHQNRIFERFYRVDKSRSKEKGGTGLGLAIVKHVVAQHKAEIFIASEEGRGTEMIVIFNKE